MKNFLKKIEDYTYMTALGALAMFIIGTVLNYVDDPESAQWVIGTGYVLGVVALFMTFINTSKNN